MAIPVIIDTDIGDDVDDALALALALRSPEIDLVGVTTVFQRSELRARLAAHLLAAFGREDVPVHAGTDRPLLGRLRPDWAPNQAAVLDGGAAGQPAAGHAVEFLIREGLRRDDLVLMPIGAMTNIALALALEPRLAGRVRILAMGGAWDRPDPEWNIRCDPEAVAAVLAAGARVEFVGLDVTTRVTLPAPDLRRLLEAPDPAGRVLANFLGAWQRGWGKDPAFCPVLHDPLAVAAVFHPELLGWEDAHVAVTLTDTEAARARTVTVPDQPPNARIARSVDVAGFADLFGQRVCGRAPGR